MTARRHGAPPSFGGLRLGGEALVRHFENGSSSCSESVGMHEVTSNKEHGFTKPSSSPEVATMAGVALAVAVPSGDLGVGDGPVFPPAGT